MTETRTGEKGPSISMLRLTAEHLKKITFRQLERPALGPDAPPTIELIQWAVQVYRFPWIRHISALLNGIVLLIDSDNKAAVRIIGRSSFEFCAHAYYVHKAPENSTLRRSTVFKKKCCPMTTTTAIWANSVIRT